jgi:transposase-like protein
MTTPPASRLSSTLATCPSCHTTDAAVTNDALSKGRNWECARCGAQWNATRLATAAAYALWLSGHNNPASKGLHEQYDNGLKRV